MGYLSDGMKPFLGAKLIHAKPMTRGDYNRYRGWEIPANENPDEDGYLVEYQDGGKPNDERHKGYISWSPADVFEKSYRSTDGLSFGLAVEALKLGQRVTRTGWNGKGMFLYFVPAASYPAARNSFGTMLGVFPGDMVPYRAYIAMKTAQNDVVPWVASQSDVLADDWQIVE
jgi:hypothetical protein